MYIRVFFLEVWNFYLKSNMQRCLNGIYFGLISPKMLYWTEIQAYGYPSLTLRIEKIVEYSHITRLRWPMSNIFFDMIWSPRIRHLEYWVWLAEIKIIHLTCAFTIYIIYITSDSSICILKNLWSTISIVTGDWQLSIKKFLHL